MRPQISWGVLWGTSLRGTHGQRHDADVLPGQV